MAPKAKEKPKLPPPLPPPPSSAAAFSLEDLFSSLQGHLQGFEYDQAARVADQILAVVPGDEDALRCKVVALIKSDAIDAALTAIEGLEGGTIDFGLYKAYCLYRQNKLHEAIKALSGQERNTKVLQLESQIFYRLGRMDACIETYDKLQEFKIDSLDLKANIIATLVAAGRASEVQGRLGTLKVKSSSSFEIAYNIACSLIEMRKYEEAEQLLLTARRIGQEMFMEDDYPDDEIEIELAPIAVQLPFVKQLLGRTEEALEAYSGILNRNLGDPSSLAVATNNIISLKGPKEAYDSLKKLDRLIEKTGGQPKFQLANGLDFKLFPRQKEALYSNRVLVLLQANKLDQAHELVSSLLDMFPESSTPVLLQAAVLVREKKVPKSEEILGTFADKFPDKSIPVLLARAQIATAAGHWQVAADSLSRIPDIQHFPATVATLVSLRERSGELVAASGVLDSAIEWWRNSMNGQSKLDTIMREAASFKLRNGQEAEAFGLYEQLVSRDGDVEALVGLVSTAAKTNLEKAELYEKKLRPLSGLKGLDVLVLEKTSGAKLVEGGSPLLAKMEVQEEAKKTKVKKRKRKPRYPKGFDPQNPGPPPDPERWLPKRERSTYRPKRKDKRAQIRGSQGSVVREKQDTISGANTSSSGATAVGSKHGPSGASKASMNSDRLKASSSKSRKKSRS